MMQSTIANTVACLDVVWITIGPEAFHINVHKTIGTFNEFMVAAIDFFEMLR